MSEDSQKENRKEIILGILGVIFDKKDRVLLNLRHDEKNPAVDNKWELPGGILEFGETAVTCLKREIFEETGFYIEPLQLVDLIWSNIWQLKEEGGEKRIQVIIIPFICKTLKGKVKTNDKEVKDSKWFAEKEVDFLDTIPGTKEIIRRAYEIKGTRRKRRFL